MFALLQQTLEQAVPQGAVSDPVEAPEVCLGFHFALATPVCLAASTQSC